MIAHVFFSCQNLVHFILPIPEWQRLQQTVPESFLPDLQATTTTPSISLLAAHSSSWLVSTRGLLGRKQSVENKGDYMFMQPQNLEPRPPPKKIIKRISWVDPPGKTPTYNPVVVQEPHGELFRYQQPTRTVHCPSIALRE